jgi:flagellar hook assembly protein FlgD
VRTLARGECEPGEYTLTWDGRDERGQPMAAGIYYVRLVTAHDRFTHMVTYLK